MDFVEVISAVLRQLKVEPYGELYFMRRAIKKAEAIIKDLGQIKNFLTNDELQKLENLLAAVYEMEDFYETFFLRIMHVRRMGFGRRYIFILCQMLKLKATVLDFRSESLTLLSKIHDAIKPLMNIKESGVIESGGEVSDVVGLEKYKGYMVTRLTDTNSPPNLAFILFSGKTGSGKTTLATEVYKSREIESHFEFRAWVSASDDPVSNLRSILQQIITGDSTVDMESTVTELGEKICAILQKKRWLVVVDNVQSPVDLSKILPGSAISEKGNGSRVILTMRSEYLTQRFIAEYGTNPVFLYKLQPLQNEDAWHLFLKKVRLPDNTVESDIPDMLKSKIINICEGNPSAIVVVAHCLSTKTCYEEWLAVLEQYPGSDILASRNRELTPGSSICLLYFGHFPKGYEIPVRRLLRLWLAEGFVTDPEPREQTERIPWDLEKKAEMYLDELSFLNIIQITKWRKDGSPKTCQILMPDIQYDNYQSKAEDIFGLLHIPPTTQDHKSTDASRKFGVRRVAEHGDIKNYFREDSHTQHLRSYLSFNTQNKDMPAEEIGNFLSTKVIGHRGFGLLKVLDLERVYKPKLPRNLGKLYQLRYLGLRWTFLDTLPPSVSKLRFLETLDVKHTNISSPPNSIWKMNYLRHLCLNGIRLDMPGKKQSISLPRLHTLWGLFVDTKSRVKNGLDGLTNLRKLGLTFHLDSVKELNKWIASLKELESLRLKSKDENGQPSKLKLKPLSGLKNLTNVYLIGNLPELNSEYFPHSMKVLTLSVSKLKKDPMPILAKLPKLRVLRLLGDSYTGKDMVWPHEGFPELTILRLWMLKELETWTVEEGVISALSELEIRCCHNLKKLSWPEDLSWTIVLTNMPKDFVDYVVAKPADDYCDTLITKTLPF